VNSTNIFRNNMVTYGKDVLLIRGIDLQKNRI